MTSPLISVVVTAYNYGTVLATALDSVVTQDYPNLEILVLDNASSDETPDIIARYTHDPRVRALRHNANIGMLANLEHGLALARGDYVAFLSADDMMLPGFLSSTMTYLQQHPDIDIAYTAIMGMDIGGTICEVLEVEGRLPAAYSGGRNELAELLIANCYMCFPTMLIRRDIFLRYGGFDPQTVKAGDYELTMRWAAVGLNFAYLPEAKIAVRCHPDQQSSYNNSIRTGDWLRASLHMAQKFVTPELAPRLRGYRHRLLAQLAFRHLRTFSAGFCDDGTLEREYQRVYTQTENILRAAEAVPIKPTVSVIVLANERLCDVSASLQSVFAQTDAAWEIILVQQPGVALDHYVATFGGDRRLRHVKLTKTLESGAALNVALRLCSGEAIAFLEPGNVFGSRHVASLRQAYADSDFTTLVSTATLVVFEADGRQIISEDAYPQVMQTHFFLSAPTRPLATISFRREALDASGAFREGDTAFCAWELLLRYAHEQKLGFTNYAVVFQVAPGLIDPRVDLTTIGSRAQMVYALYPTQDPIVQREREAYLAGIEMLARRPQHFFESGAGQTELHRVVAGGPRTTTRETILA